MSGKASTASDVVADLVQRAAQGDRAAQDELLAHYRSFIRSAVRARLGVALRAREETADLEQQAMVAIVAALPQQKWQGKGAFLAWLRRVASAEVIDRARFHQAKRRDVGREVGSVSRPGGAQRAPGPGPESWVLKSEALRELEAALDALPPKQAQALALWHQGHTHAEIAEAVGGSEESVRKLVSRGHTKLAGMLPPKK